MHKESLCNSLVNTNYLVVSSDSQDLNLTITTTTTAAIVVVNQMMTKMTAAAAAAATTSTELTSLTTRAKELIGCLQK